MHKEYGHIVLSNIGGGGGGGWTGVGVPPNFVKDCRQSLLPSLYLLHVFVF